MKRLADTSDLQVGKRIRLQRLLMGISQERLASRLGVSHQLVQKYEVGQTRIGSSRLRAVATALGVQVDFFFAFKEPVTRASRAQSACLDLAQTPEGAKLFQAFARVRSERVRRKLILLVEAASEAERKDRGTSIFC